MSARQVVLALALAVTLGAGGCNAVLAIPDPTLVQHVTCTDGTCVCEAGWGGCDHGDDCATDLSSNPHHCGACGRDCLGAVCTAGQCVLGNFPDAHGLSLFEGALYVGRCGGKDDAFLRVPLRAGEPVLDVRSDHCGLAQLVFGDQLYWTDTTNLRVARLAPQAAPQFLHQASAVQVVASPSHVYWRQPDGTIQRRAGDSGFVDQIFSSESYGLAADEGVAYWLADSGVFTLPDTKTFPPLPPIAVKGKELQLDAKNLYIGASDGIRVLPRAGGELSLLVPGASGARLAVRGPTLYWLDDVAHSVNAVPIAGGAPKVLATGVSFDGATAIAVDDAAVYWLAGTVVGKVAH